MPVDARESGNGLEVLISGQLGKVVFGIGWAEVLIRL